MTGPPDAVRCGPLRRDPDGSWWHGDTYLGDDDHQALTIRLQEDPSPSEEPDPRSRWPLGDSLRAAFTAEIATIERAAAAMTADGVPPTVTTEIVIETLLSLKHRVFERLQAHYVPLGDLEATAGELDDGGVCARWGGACPVTGWGHITAADQQWPFRYRSRGTGWTIEVFRVGVTEEDVHEESQVSPVWTFAAKSYRWPDGGWVTAAVTAHNLRQGAQAFRASQGAM